MFDLVVSVDFYFEQLRKNQRDLSNQLARICAYQYEYKYLHADIKSACVD